MLQLIPQRSFTLVRQLNNPYITDTFYVRAVVRNAYTDEILATLDLTDKGGQRFKKDWQVPADVQGQGFFISIVTSVYTDDTYTTKSQDYGDEETTYLVARLASQTRTGAGGGVDAFTVRSIIQDELDKRKPDPITFPEIPTPKEYEMRWEEVFGAIAEARDAIARIPKIDLTPILERLNTVEQAIMDKEVTPETDLTPLIEMLNERDTIDDRKHEDVIGNFELIENNLIKAVKESVDDAMQHTKFVSQLVTGAVRDDSPKKETTQGQIYDFNSLTK
jgi:hypothetical protein